jgi:hypothetical protein
MSAPRSISVGAISGTRARAPQLVAHHERSWNSYTRPVPVMV